MTRHFTRNSAFFAAISGILNLVSGKQTKYGTANGVVLDKYLFGVILSAKRGAHPPPSA
jgi:hypothetical protein